MSEPLRWGVLSTAHINEKLLAGAARSPDVEVVAIASRDTRRAGAFAARWGIGRAYGSYDDLLSDDAVDAVYVPLPNGLHHPWTLRALRAGKHGCARSRTAAGRQTSKKRSLKRTGAGSSSVRASCIAIIRRSESSRASSATRG